MKKLSSFRSIAVAILMTVISSGDMAAQTTPIIIEPLFEYPVAPDSLEGLAERTNYLMEHFWDGFDFNRRDAVDQNALNDAFSVYSAAIPYADRAVVMKSIERLTKNLKGNPTLLFQFTKSAEEMLYGPRATFWSDEAYMPFLKAVLADKKLSDVRKQRYQLQYDLLTRTEPGQKFPTLHLTLPDRRRYDFKQSAPFTLIEIGNPDCEDCRFAKTRILVASDIVEKIEDGSLGMYFIVADAVPEEEEELLGYLNDYPQSWITGISYGADDLLDLRTTPSFYILDKNGKILYKNMDVETAIARVRQLLTSN